jgi:GGDEF domain-containing protein
MGSLDRARLHLAIGDVDDLKRYVTERRSADPTSFGHLAGNDCMRQVGLVTVRWAEEELSAYPFSMCGTFGGDEVIVTAAGTGQAAFMDAIQRLSALLRGFTPRSCSFAVASTEPIPAPLSDPAAAYERLVTRVDAALFDRKAALRAQNTDPCGEVVDVGIVDLGCADSERKD